MPFLTYPLALIALAGLPALAAIYFLRNRFRRFPVSSLMLWRFKSRFLEGGSRITRIVTPLTFFLELLIILLIILAAVEPRWPVDKNRIPVFIILDDSISMLAGTGADTPRERAVKEILRIARRDRRQLLHFIIAGKEPQFIKTSVSGEDAASHILRQWSCLSTSASLEDSIRFACEIAGEKSAILLVTDHEPSQGLINGEGIKWLAFGEKFPNAGITNAVRTNVSGKDRCFFEISGFSNEPVKTVITVEDGKGKELFKKPLMLQQNAAERVILEVPHETPTLHAWLDHDALEQDNHAHLAPSSGPGVKIRIDIKDKNLMTLFDDGLKATGMYLPESTNPEMVITDSSGTETDTMCWIVFVHSGKDTSAYTGPFIMDMAHPLTKGIELDGVIWGGVDMDVPAGLPVITAGNFSLITDEIIRSNQHEIHICLNPDYSNIQDTPNWPILMWNLLNWRLNVSAGFKAANAGIGDDIRRESNLSDCVSGEWGRLVNTEVVKREYPGTSWAWILAAMGALAAHLGILTQKMKNY